METQILTKHLLDSVSIYTILLEDHMYRSPGPEEHDETVKKNRRDNEKHMNHA